MEKRKKRKHGLLLLLKIVSQNKLTGGLFNAP